jgi:hypothetical protein
MSCDIETEILLMKQAEENTRLLKRIDELKQENARLRSGLLDILETHDKDPEFVSMTKYIVKKTLEGTK